MNLIEIVGQFYCAEGEAPRELLSLLGEDGSVAYNPEHRIAEFKLSLTAEGNLAATITNAIASTRDALATAGVDEADLFELKIDSEQLVAIGGNLHRRGRLIEAEANDRRRDVLFGRANQG